MLIENADDDLSTAVRDEGAVKARGLDQDGSLDGRRDDVLRGREWDSEAQGERQGGVPPSEENGGQTAEESQNRYSSRTVASRPFWGISACRCSLPPGVAH